MYEIASPVPWSNATRYPTGTYECPCCAGQVSIGRRFCFPCSLAIAEGSGWPTVAEERAVQLYGWLGGDCWQAACLPASM